MAVGEQSDGEALDEVFLTDDDLVQLGEERGDEGGGFLDFFVDGGDAGVHVGQMLPGKCQWRKPARWEKIRWPGRAQESAPDAQLEPERFLCGSSHLHPSG